MKTITKKILLFILPFLIFYPLLEIKLSQIPNIYDKKKEFIESQINEIEVLSMGSSHGDAINPDYLSQKTFTFNYKAQDLYYDMKLINTYIDRMPRLKVVILPISYFSLEFEIDRSKTWTLAPFYYHAWRIPPQHLDSFFNLRYFSLTAAYGWEKVVHYIQNGFTDNEWETMRMNGQWMPGNQVLKDSPHESENGYYKVLSHQELMDPGSTQENLKILENIITSCQSRHIDVILVTTPAHHTYFDFLDKTRWQVVQNAMKYLMDNYHVVYKNYLKDPRFYDSDFSDNDHVNTQGSIKFSQILDEEIIRPLFAKGN
jgi:hypothetical protein